jgi:uncharacterized integral membrane protein
MNNESQLPHEHRDRPPLFETIKLGVGILLAAVVVVFTVQNGAAADVRFLVWTFNLSLSLLILGVLLSGVFAGWVVTSWYQLKRSRAVRRALKGK